MRIFEHLTALIYILLLQIRTCYDNRKLRFHADFLSIVVVFVDDFKVCRRDSKRESLYAQSLKSDCRNLVFAVSARLDYNTAPELVVLDDSILFELRIVHVRGFFRRFESGFRKSVRQILFERRRLRIVCAEFYAVFCIERRRRVI